jgi:uncharacterized protein (TIGR03437 family)
MKSGFVRRFSMSKFSRFGFRRLLTAFSVLALSTAPTVGQTQPRPSFVNGTFNTDASGWVLGGTGCTPAVYDSQTGFPSGSLLLKACGEPDSDPTAAQTVTGLTPGVTYQVSVDVLAVTTSSATGSSFGIYLDSQPSHPIFLGNFSSQNYYPTPVRATFTATSTSHTIIFAAEVDPRTPGISTATTTPYNIDNIVLKPVASSYSRGTFQSALANDSVTGQNFDGIASGTVINTVSGVTYTPDVAAAQVTNRYLTTTYPNGLGSAETSFFSTSNAITISFSSPITAFAMDINTYATGDGAYIATLDNGYIAYSKYEVFPNSSTGQFLGFSTPTPFTSVRIAPSYNPFGNTNTSYTLDTLVYGDATRLSALTISTKSLPNGVAGQPYSASLGVSGGSQPYTYTVIGSLPTGLTVSSEGKLAGTPATDSVGPYSFAISVMDSAQNTVSQGYDLNIAAPQVTSTLAVSSFTLPSAAVGVPYNSNVPVTGGATPYTFSSRGNIGLTITPAGAVTGTVPVGTAPGIYPLDFTVTDALGATFSTVLNVPVTGALQFAPGFTLAPATEGTAYSATFQTNGGSGASTFSATGLPAYLTLSPSGVLAGTAPMGSAGSVPFQVTVSTADGMLVTQNYVLQIVPPSVILSNTALPNATERVPYSATLQGSNGTAPYTFTALHLPTWLTLNSAGMLSGTPPLGSAGGFNITFTVTDSRKSVQTSSLPLTVLAANGGLTLTSASPLLSAIAGTPYSLALSAQGGTGPYVYSGSGLPAGMTITSTGYLTGTPTTPGDYFVTAQVTDRNNKISASSLELVVTAAPLTIANPSPLPTGQLTQFYSKQLDATGGSGSATFAVTSGSLPSGITLSDNGILSGTPTALGTFSFTVSATDSSTTVASRDYQITINPAGSYLLLSEGSLFFKALVNGNAPASQDIAVIATGSQPPDFTVTAHAPWISLTPTMGSAPSNITVSVDPSQLVAGTYTDMLTITSSGLNQQVPVTFVVSPGNGALTSDPASLNLITDGSSLLTQTLVVTNPGGNSVDFVASADQPWVTFGQTKITVGPNSTALVTVTINSGLAAGSYGATIHFDSPTSAVAVPVSLLVSSQPQITLDKQGVLLQSRSGNGVSGPQVRTVNVLATSQSPLNFTVTQVGGEGYLTLLTTSGTASASSPGQISFSLPNAAQLRPGAYYARLEIRSPDAVNSPQEFVVVLNVRDAAQQPVPEPMPAGLTFVTPAGSSSAQSTPVYTSSDQAVSYAASVYTEDNGGWLSVTPKSGTVSTSAPASLSVTTDASHLQPGVYRGAVNVSIQNLAVRSIHVTLIVPHSASATATSRTRLQAAACAPAKLVLTQTGLPGNFATPASWPRSVSVRLNDDCGSIVANGQVVAEFSNGDAPQILRLTDAANGIYAQDWVPVHPLSQITITTRATFAGLASATNKVTGSVQPNSAPTLAVNGTLHNLNPQLGGPLAPGTIVQIFGTNLSGTTGSATALPLSGKLNSTSVLVEGKPIPLYFVSPNQINALLPSALVPGRQYQLLVNANGALTEPQPFNTQTVTPGVARLTNGEVIAQHGDFSLVTPQNPAKPGEFLVIYLAGLGSTSQTVTDGSASPSSPLARTTNAPVVTVDGKSAPVFFAGLTPGLAGLYQINFQVPQDAPSGSLRLDISQGAAGANTSVLVVSQ